MIITIDGPAGSGKSTAARKLAARLEIPYLDTGAMYRVTTLAALHDGVDLNDPAALSELARTLDFELDCRPTYTGVTLRGHDVTEAIRSGPVANMTGFIADVPAIRSLLVDKQRAIARRLGSLVTEGRDQGSVAFPHADLKFFMTATLESRARRRQADLIADGEPASYEDVLRDLRERDERDQRRPVGRLREPDGAIHMDTTSLNIAEVVDRLLEQLVARGLIDHIPEPLDHGPAPHELRT